jgi:hypothetical protein
VLVGCEYPYQLKRANRELRELTGLQNIRPHDLRRTGRTHVSGLGIRDEVGEALLNHAKEAVNGNVQPLFLLDREKGSAEALASETRRPSGPPAEGGLNRGVKGDAFRLSQKELAQKLGLDPATIWRLETGDVRKPYPSLTRLFEEYVAGV